MASDTLKILYDHQIFSLQKYGGISRYFSELMVQYKSEKDIDFELACKYSDNQYLHDMVKLDFIKKSSDANSKIRKYYNYALNRLNSMSIISQGDYDVLHPTYYDPYFLNKLNGKPFVITVHDLTQDLFPQYFKNPGRNTRMKRAVMEKAEKVIAISNHTKGDIINYFNVPEEKITVIYHGNSLKSIKTISGNPGTGLSEKRYVLFVGLRGGYKNFHTFVAAISKILKEDEGLEVICVGAGPFVKEEIELLEIHGIQQRFSQVSVNDEELTELYSNALALVFPSLYEGFGMPILEAMDCGCPAILSNTSSMPEIGGNAARYFDPEDIESIRDSIEKVIYDEELRQKMILDGRNRADDFSWQRTAKETAKVYRSLL